MAGVDRTAVDDGRQAQTAAAQQHVVVADGNVAAARQSQLALELVETRIRLLTLYGKAEIAQTLLVVAAAELGEQSVRRALYLQVGLAVQVGRSHVAVAVLCLRVKQQDVARYDLIGQHLDNVSTLE